jgi:hypothetical protein
MKEQGNNWQETENKGLGKNKKMATSCSSICIKLKLRQEKNVIKPLKKV